MYRMCFKKCKNVSEKTFRNQSSVKRVHLCQNSNIYLFILKKEAKWKSVI